jgi:hypothetical protein
MDVSRFYLVVSNSVMTAAFYVLSNLFIIRYCSSNPRISRHSELLTTLSKEYK